jgi:polysaccharide biosynthesis/export protein
MNASPPRRRARALVAALMLCAASLSFAGSVRAADYVVGAEDVLAVSVWLHPELERTVPVGSDGNIVFPPVGDIPAAGLTARQLADKIGERLSTYLRQTATVTVTVSQYMSRSVYVSGAVAKPGRYGFENIPSLVDVLSAAGGALPGSDLSQIQLVRRDGETRRTQIVDVSAVLRDGDTSRLPALQPGDAINIPVNVVAGTTGMVDAVGVMGQVNKPGLYPVGPGADLWMVLAAAGGVSPTASMGSVRVLTRGPEGVTVTAVDLAEHLQRGTKSPVTIRPGDVVFVSERTGAKVGRAFAGLYQLILIGRDALNVAVLVDYLKQTPP